MTEAEHPSLVTDVRQEEHHVLAWKRKRWSDAELGVVHTAADHAVEGASSP